jgi:hypothetical protein
MARRPERLKHFFEKVIFHLQLPICLNSSSAAPRALEPLVLLPREKLRRLFLDSPFPLNDHVRMHAILRRQLVDRARPSSASNPTFALNSSA